ncbi:general secretion pathway protein F, partial [Pseudomonas syringae pv. actinidiae ICMP 19070]
MSLFKYRALDAQGVAQNGTLEARDQDAAIAALQKRGLMVLQVDVAGLGGLRRV